MLQYASFVGFLRTILIILLIYYGIKILTRLFAPYLIRYMSKKAEKKFGEGFKGFQYQYPPKPKNEGETTIDKMPNKSGSTDKKVGEYVDYEEID